MKTSFLDVTLDHRSGRMTGQIIRGQHAGRSLDEFDFATLVRLGATFDSDSLAILESYLDRRFPGWGQNAQGNGAGRNNSSVGSAASGKMSEQEAYEILGLHAGASADDISRAHRALMKKLHPDQGGSTYLAARVNLAKDTLLQRHRN